MSGRRAGNHELRPRMPGANLTHGPDGEVEALLRVMTVGEQDIWPPDRIAVDRQTAAEAVRDRPRKSGSGDVAAGWTVDRLSLVDPPDDVADVVPVDKQLVRLLHRTAVRPSDKAGRAQDDSRKQPVVGVGDPSRLPVDVAWIHQAVGLIQVYDVRHVDQARRPPCDPSAGLVATDDGVDSTEAPRIQGHEQRGGRHLDGLSKRKPPRKLGQEGAYADVPEQVRIAARSVNRRRKALDLEAPPPQSEHLL